jgi:formamidopyrimidine-DNA glycosylase
VETVRRVLKRRILGRKIKNVNVIYDKIVESNLDDFKKILPGLTFQDILRRGKWLIFDLGDYYLCSHLRMEGKYFIKPSSEEIVKHEHIIFSLDDNYDLRYHDTRKFGRMDFVKKEDLETVEGVHKQGIEPISDDLTKEYLYDRFKKSNKYIKTLLLDQTIISGLGNIYADEVLFGASIKPTRRGNSIKLSECQKIVDASRKIILKAMEEGGTTIRSYTSSLGVTGSYQDFLMVHQRKGEECKVCHNIIKKITVDGRGTYYCSKCQH